ncbi:allergin-1 isoform X2 [Mesocricetus auratus]|uniref:Allergin-1 isoform X2 n=1 Tax=Mesocricetus auratus TaxID=10036 RepID=A0ABM2XTH0_MESAU|nr:allergin-1 isoform X2 [Mesocricetus auratus]
MGDSGPPMCASVSFKGISRWLDKLLLGAIFLSTAFQNTAVDCKKGKRNSELLSPNLNSSVNVVRMGQNVSLSCSSKNAPMNITYSLFLGTKHLQTKETRAEAVTFYLKISNTNETGPYKCKINVSNYSQKYSQELKFEIAKEDSCPSCLLSQLLPGVLLGLLVIVLVLVFVIQPKYKKEAGKPQELHYATPVFKEVAPREQEGCVGNNPSYIYSELTH